LTDSIIISIHDRHYGLPLGIGIGGEYPLSAAITSETSSSENEAKNLAMVGHNPRIHPLL
jgi:hypothetical protein